MKPYTAHELNAMVNAMEALSERLAGSECAFEVLTLIRMIRERDQVVAELLDKIDVLERVQGAK